MNRSTLVTYKSVTGYTKQYAEWIAADLDCKIINLKNISEKTMSEYHTIVFGGRFHAGFVDGLKRAKKLFMKSTASNFVVFTTGATPNSAREMIEEAWKNNFTADELIQIPHFYLPSGLRYEKMPLGDQFMLKVFAAMVKRKKEKSEYDKAMELALKNSYDLSSRKYIASLVSHVLQENQNK